MLKYFVIARNTGGSAFSRKLFYPIRIDASIAVPYIRDFVTRAIFGDDHHGARNSIRNILIQPYLQCAPQHSNSARMQ